MTDEIAIWERIPGRRHPYQQGESRAAYHAFLHYRDLGPSRSIVAAYNDHRTRCRGREGSVKRASGRWTAWSMDWRWTERAEAWDRHLDLVRRAEIEAEERRIAALVAEKRKGLPEREIALAEALIRKAEEMLRFPLAQVTRQSEGGREVTIIEPARWSFAALARIVDVADRLMRLATGLETDRHRVDMAALVREEARRAAAELGISEEEAVAQAEEIVREWRARAGEDV